MERYTWREHGKPRLCMGDKEFVGGPIIEKFTAYEDSGLTPDLINKVNKRLAEYEISGLTPAKASKYAKAEAEGRLVVLPCTIEKRESTELIPKLTNALKKLETDRDYWKTKAEARERAIYQNCNYCTLYLKNRLTDDCWTRKQNTGVIDFGCKGWQFDEDEFARGEKN